MWSACGFVSSFSCAGGAGAAAGRALSRGAAAAAAASGLKSWCAAKSGRGREVVSSSGARVVRASASSSMAASVDAFKVALCQVAVGDDKQKNLAHARQMLRSAKERGAELAVLPECFNSPYGTQFFREYAETLPEVGEDAGAALSPSVQMLLETAQETGMYIVGGSVPEITQDGKVYNTSLSVSPQGQLVAKHRKVHLFDIDVQGGIRFMESDTLSPGQCMTTFDMANGVRVGVSICYDIRFPELSMLMAEAGCQLLCFPGAFNMTTGPAHWELLGRARALDNQLYVAMCSPCRDVQASYHAWGHSSLFSPWGEVLATTEEKEDIVVGTVDLKRLESVRSSIPVRKQKRSDLYRLTKL
ncbi:Omega-amidase NIT2 [Porphyridium purpureum]|uniref:Omega-amidase NIT2 n=1 Tax=Porphyridium purpureum TaxID=35688 RepID=A0A5J4YUY8_PORPP|nr:Omega-amidase NIT2 [Porphyridium purpureum]|eukprot:POR5875..scf227_4